MEETCPFRVGQTLVYKPSAKGIGYTSPGTGLVQFQEYVVKEIPEGRYILVEGYNPPGGGIHWTEFVAVEKSR
mgnify:CR=1 FL=1